MGQTRKMFLSMTVLLLLLHPGSSGATSADGTIARVWEHLGGKSTYSSARYLQFTWAVQRGDDVVVARRHTWDRHTGDYLVSMRERESGDSLDVFFNVNTKQGTVLRNSTLVEGEVKAEIIDDAYGAYINDTYWLIVPAKLEDPGVRTELAETLSGEDADTTVLHLAFDGVGLTPGDQYWLYVTESGRITRWRYVLEGGREGNFTWSDERDCGMGLRFALTKWDPSRALGIVFPDVRFSADIDRSIFEPTSQGR